MWVAETFKPLMAIGVFQGHWRARPRRGTMAPMGTVYHVGTSGWHYDEWGHGLFYPEELPKSRWLRFYAQRFDTVEINNTFYRLPKEEVPKSWGSRRRKDFASP